MFSKVVKKYHEKEREILKGGCLTEMTQRQFLCKSVFLGHGNLIVDNIYN